MQKSSKISLILAKNRDFLPAIGFVCLSLVFILISIRFFFGYIEAKNQLSVTTKEINELQLRISKLDALKEGELTELQGTIIQALPPEKPIFNALKAINQLASESGIRVAELESRPGSVATPSSQIVVNQQSKGSSRGVMFERLNIDLSIQGQLDAINTFLDQLVTTTPLMELRAVRIFSDGRNRNNSAPSVFSSEIELEIYWKPELQASSVRVNSNSKIENLSKDETEILSQLESLRKF